MKIKVNGFKFDIKCTHAIDTRTSEVEMPVIEIGLRVHSENGLFYQKSFNTTYLSEKVCECIRKLINED